MNKMFDFLNENEEPVDNSRDEMVMGNYGCSVCELDSPFAKFNEAKGILYWTCVEGHRTEITIV